LLRYVLVPEYALFSTDAVELMVPSLFQKSLTPEKSSYYIHTSSLFIQTFYHHNVIYYDHPNSTTSINGDIDAEFFNKIDAELCKNVSSVTNWILYCYIFY
jgi:hypothetical protein